MTGMYVPYSHARGGGNFFKSFGKVFQVVGVGKEEKAKRKEKKGKRRGEKGKKKEEKEINRINRKKKE